MNPSQKKISSETENQHLPTTAPALESNVHEKRVAGHSPGYSRGKTLFEVEVGIIPTPYYSQTNVRNIVKICFQEI